jgi:hypothetical protein
VVSRSAGARHTAAPLGAVGELGGFVALAAAARRCSSYTL